MYGEVTMLGFDAPEVPICTHQYRIDIQLVKCWEHMQLNSQHTC